MRLLDRHCDETARDSRGEERRRPAPEEPLVLAPLGSRDEELRSEVLGGRRGWSAGISSRAAGAWAASWYCRPVPPWPCLVWWQPPARASTPRGTGPSIRWPAYATPRCWQRWRPVSACCL